MNYVNDLGLPCVSMDYEGAMDQAYGHLLERGRRNVVFLCYHRECQPNVRHIRRHAELAALWNGRAELTHVDLDRAADLREACDAEARRRDGYVVDGAWQFAALRAALEAAGRAPGRDCDVVTLCPGERPPAPEPGCRVLEAQPERVGQEAWRLMERILTGEGTEPSVLIPFRMLDVQERSESQWVPRN